MKDLMGRLLAGVGSVLVLIAFGIFFVAMIVFFALQENFVHHFLGF